MLDIAAIIPRADLRGGAQRLFFECVARWQDRHHLTLYSTAFDECLLAEHAVDLARVRLVRLSPLQQGPHADLLYGVLMPKVWRQEIGSHDIYHAHQWPMHLLDRHPLVWYPHEPRRWLREWRYNTDRCESAEAWSQRLHELAAMPRCTVEDPFFEGALEALRVFDLQGNPDHVVANSRLTACNLQGVYGWEVPDVVYPGVNPADFPDVPPKDDMVLSLGRLRPIKRIRLAMEAVAQVPDVRLSVVGEGGPGERERYLRLARTLGIAHRFELHLNPTNEQVRTLLARCRMAVFPPLRESFGIVALEALAAGRPLIAVNEGGYTEVVDASCSFLVPPHPSAIARKIAFLRRRPDIARRMGQAGRSRAAAFCWDRTANELMAIIENVHRSWCASRLPYREDGRYTFLAGLSPRKSEEPASAFSRGQREDPNLSFPLVGIHYHCGYGDGLGEGRWTLPMPDMPLMGYYASGSANVIENQLRTLVDLGIDCVVLHLHLRATGVDGHELLACENVRAVGAIMNLPLRFALYLRWCDDRHLALPVQPPDRAVRDSIFRLIPNAFFNQGNYLHLGDCPLLFADGPLVDAADDDTPWQRHSRGAGGRALVIKPCGPRFSHGNLTIATVSPGPAQAGACRRTTYRNALAAACKGEPSDLILIDSFNDYHAATHIEASQQNGAVFLKLTREFIRNLRLPRAVGANPIA